MALSVSWQASCQAQNRHTMQLWLFSVCITGAFWIRQDWAIQVAILSNSFKHSYRYVLSPWRQSLEIPTEKTLSMNIFCEKNYHMAQSSVIIARSNITWFAYGKTMTDLNCVFCDDLGECNMMSKFHASYVIRMTHLPVTEEGCYSLTWSKIFGPCRKTVVFVWCQSHAFVIMMRSLIFMPGDEIRIVIYIWDIYIYIYINMGYKWDIYIWYLTLR